MNAYAINNRKKEIATLTALIVLTAGIAWAGPTFTEVDLDADSRWDVTYMGRTYDAEANTTTFAYNVTVNNDPALSHFTAGFPFCDDPAAVNGADPSDAVSVGLDPTSGVDGIKWDLGLEPGNSRVHAYTLQGNIAEGTITVAVKAGTFVATANRPGPSCDATPVSNTYTIAGCTFIDANGNGLTDADDGALANTTVELRDADGNIVATVATDAWGNYEFADMPEGAYTISVPVATADDDLNEIIDAYFTGTTTSPISVNLAGADSLGNCLGFAPRVGDIADDLNPGDPDNDGLTLAGNGRTIGFWKHQLAVMIKGKGRAQVDAATMQAHITAIESLLLYEPFQMNGSPVAAHDIMSMRSSDALDLLRKQLLGTEFNDVAGWGLADGYEALQDALIAWGEYLAAHSAEFTRDELIAAKDIFDGINNTGNH